MGTRSRIGKVMPDGTVKSIYCHWDGYLSHNGRILLNYYSDPEKVDKLLALGWLSSLGVRLSSDDPAVEAADNLEGHCKVFDNWGGDTQAQTDANTATFWKEAYLMGEEFAYLFTPSGWVYRSGGNRNLPLTSRNTKS